ncbi:Cold shock protein, CspA family [Limimonas halophila]|uniref:Cold shock protein, CspA family n=1 Tax=Limimonas halophila TaxID=1082479 RepID=A0A1G7Q4H0_9PROT|nr:cold shock domain-containing protein [Limimonas halophila]SDF93442.1 Cold shock protein, CspA family [Limimonas halophila]
MSRSVLRLKDHNHEQTESGGVGRSKIDRGEWPKIIERRQAGEAIAAIARDYNVTPSAISYIVKKAQADPAGYAGPPADGEEAEVAAEADGHAMPVAETDPQAAGVAVAVDGDGPSPDGGQGAPSTATTPDAPGTDEPVRPEAPARSRGAEPAQPTAPAADSGSRERTPANDELQSDLARRLIEAAGTCAKTWDGGAGGDELARAAHEVRRALAAIEIADSKRSSPKRSKAPAPEASEPAPMPAEPAAPAPAAGRREPGEVQIPEGRSLGTVKFYKPSKGFGFVVPDDGGGDIYLAAETVEAAGLDDLQTGDRVAIERGPGRKGEEVKSLQLLAS